MGNGTVIPTRCLGGRPDHWLAPAQPKVKNKNYITPPPPDDRGSRLPPATLNESAIMLLPNAENEKQHWLAESFTRGKQPTEPVKASTDRTGSDGIKVNRSARRLSFSRKRRFSFIPVAASICRARVPCSFLPLKPDHFPRTDGPSIPGTRLNRRGERHGRRN
jgi:hypothetical protein